MVLIAMGVNKGHVDLSFRWDHTCCEGYKNKAPSSALVCKVKILAIGMVAIPLDAAKEYIYEVASLCLAAFQK